MENAYGLPGESNEEMVFLKVQEIRVKKAG